MSDAAQALVARLQAEHPDQTILVMPDAFGRAEHEIVIILGPAIRALVEMDRAFAEVARRGPVVIGPSLDAEIIDCFKRAAEPDAPECFAPPRRRWRDGKTKAEFRQAMKGKGWKR